MTDGDGWWLRRARADDVPGLHGLLSLPPVCRYLCDGAPPPVGLAAGWVEAGEAAAAGGGFGLQVLEGSAAPHAGLVRLSALAEPDALELTYALDPRIWGQGLAARMAWTAIDFAFRRSGVRRIVAGADLANRASIALIGRLGMRYLRNVRYPLGPGVEYGLRRGDPAPPRRPALLPMTGGAARSSAAQ